MEKITLELVPRTVFGKGEAGRLRRSGLIPCIVYGKEMDPIPGSIQDRQLRTAFRHGLRIGRLVELSWSDGRPPLVALLRELQQDPVTSKPLHLDFQVAVSTQTIVVEVPVEVEGEAAGVREEG